MQFRHLFSIIILSLVLIKPVAGCDLFLLFASDEKKMIRHYEKGKKLLEKDKVNRASKRFKKGFELVGKLQPQDPDYYLFPLLMKLKGKWKGRKIEKDEIDHLYSLLSFGPENYVISPVDSSHQYYEYYENIEDTFDLNLGDVFVLTYYGMMKYGLYKDPQKGFYMLNSGLNHYQKEKSEISYTGIIRFLKELQTEFDMKNIKYGKEGEVPCTFLGEFNNAYNNPDIEEIYRRYCFEK